MCRDPKCREKRRQRHKTAKARPAVPAKAAPEILTSDSEGQRLWNWLLFGFSSLGNFVRGYVSLQVPGDPLPQLYALRDQLTETIQLIESRNQPEPGERKNP